MYQEMLHSSISCVTVKAMEKRRAQVETYHARCLSFVELHLLQHLIALFHHQSSFVSVSRDIAIHLEPIGYADEKPSNYFTQ